MKLKVVVIAATIVVVLMISAAVLYVEWDNIMLNHDGYTVDWNDPWYVDDEIYYFVRIKNHTGDIIEKWVPEKTAEVVVEAKKRGYDIVVH